MIELHMPLPPAGLHPNSRQCWQAKARLVRKARREAGIIAIQLRPDRPFERATVEAEFFLPRRRDLDGLVAWLKAYLDGLQDGGILANDSGIVSLTATQTTGRAAGRKLVLRITEC